MPKAKKATKAAPKKAAASGKYDKAWQAADAVGSAAGPMGSLGVKAARGLASLFGYGAYRARRGARPGIRKSGKAALTVIKGHGDYTSQGTPGAAGLGVPQFSNVKAEANGNIRFAHREYLQDVISTTTFTNTAYAVQPGLASSFPFLAAIASNFEQYRFHGLVYYYRTMSGTAVGSTSTALGSIIMATQYNSLSPAFSTKSEMENYQFAVSGVPCYDLQHIVECDKKETPVNVMYVRTGGVPTGADERMYDLGTFNLATAGMQAASNNVVGELWVSYDVEMIKPRVPSGAGLNLALTDHFQLSTNVSSPNNFLASSGTITPVVSSTIQGSATGSTYTFPANFTDGIFLYVYTVAGASSTLTTPMGVPTVGTNVAMQSLWGADAVSTRQISGGAVASAQLQVGTFKFNGGVTPSQSFITLTSGTLPGTITSGDFWVTVLTPGLVSLAESKFGREERSLAHKIKDDMRIEFASMLRAAGLDVKAYAPLLDQSGVPQSLEHKEEHKEESEEDIESEIARLLAKRKELQKIPIALATEDFHIVPTPKKTLR